MVIRSADPKDVPAILDLIIGLAVFENEPDQVINTVDKLHDDLFVSKYCEAFVAEFENKVVGFSIFYTSYSTWKGPCIYLEDLFVLEDYRKTGVGSQLFDKVVETAKVRKVARMDWQVLDWNEPAIQFYKKKNATLDGEWINGRLFFED
jgi:GNAT superfamily N-acetyltransferase